MKLGGARRQDIQQTQPVHFVDAPDEICRNPLARQALPHGLLEPFRVQVGGGVVAELVAVLLFRLLQAQLRQVPQVAVQGLRRFALPVLGDVSGPGGFLAPLACLELIQGGTHVTDGKVRHRNGVLTNGLLQQPAIAATDIDQGDLGTGDHAGKQGPCQDVFRFVTVGQHRAVQVATQQDFRRMLHGAQHTCTPWVQESSGTRSPSPSRSSRLIRSHFTGGIEMEWVLLGILVLVVVFAVVIYNRLVTARNRYKNAFAQIDVQLTRRYDLIPNLVKVAERYMSHERDTLEAVIQARNQAMGNLKDAAADPGNAEAMRRLSSSEQGLASALGRLFALSENYPDLKANQNMMQLSEELVSTENRVAFARQGFNDAVMDYNNQREMFPNNLIANNFGFQPAQLLDIEEPEKRAPVQVNFQ
jgi:LemA protein